MSDNQSKKRKFRGSKAWKQFRHKMNIKDRSRDVLTGRKLVKGYELHHLDLDPEHYHLLDEENFASLNKMSHKFIHWLFPYYKADPAIIGRIVAMLDRMVELNGPNFE